MVFLDDVTVVIGTFGHKKWFNLAQDRAIPSARAQGAGCIHVHGESIAHARNLALSRVRSEWVCHLDADDELEPGYFDAMEKASADLRAPAVRYVWYGQPGEPPGLPPHCHDDRNDLTDGNWLVVGTLVRADMVRAAGCWRDWPMYEDWDLWQRCWKLGASIEAVPDAVYRAHARWESRNRQPSREERLAAHHMIRRANFPELYEDGAA